MARLAFIPLLVGCGSPSAPPVSGSTPGTPRPPRIVSAKLVGDPVFYRRQGDLWMNTWADDDNLYMSWGDGTGRGDCCVSFGDGPADNTPTCVPVPDTVSLEDVYENWDPQVCIDNNYCCCRFTDAGVTIFETAPMAPSSCEGECVVGLHVPNGISPIAADGTVQDRSDKPSSLLFVDGTLYWAGHYPLGTPTHGYIAYSNDYGRDWTEETNTPWDASTPFRVMMFINMGKAYSLNTDGYVYALAMGRETGWSSADGAAEDGTVYLARVPKGDIADYAAYRYFAGTDAAGNPDFRPAITDARPLAGLKAYMQGSAIYHPGTGQYLFLTSAPGDLYAAPEPWGPWQEVSNVLGDSALPANWPAGGYIPGLITKGADANHVYFTISGVDGIEHYQLTMGEIELTVAP